MLSGYQSHIVVTSIDAETDTLVNKKCLTFVEKCVQMSSLNFTETSPWFNYVSLDNLKFLVWLY